MNAATPAAGELFVTQSLVVSDQDRSRDFYQSVFGADVVRDRDPVILTLANTRIVLNVGGPTDDKPTVRLAPPADPDVSSGFLNLQVRDIAKTYRDWSARGAAFLTEPKDHGYEIRAYIRDPDGHLIEVGQTRERHRSTSGRIQIVPICGVAGLPEFVPVGAPNGGSACVSQELGLSQKVTLSLGDHAAGSPI